VPGTLLVEGFNQELYAEDIIKLKGTNWLNDEVKKSYVTRITSKISYKIEFCRNNNNHYNNSFNDNTAKWVIFFTYNVANNLCYNDYQLFH
jgi:phosphomevalonate kinase